MKWPYSFIAVAAISFTAMTALIAQKAATVSVVRDPGCTCCLKWVDHLEKAGFQTNVVESSEMDTLKASKGVPEIARSCHTATVGGYVIEGHVPAADIKRLLAERPDVVGLAVPGMPAGSPGMEVASGRTAPFDVLAFDKNGKTTVFASHR